MPVISRVFVSELHSCVGSEVVLRGWNAYRDGKALKYIRITGELPKI